MVKLRSSNSLQRAGPTGRLRMKVGITNIARLGCKATFTVHRE